MMDGRDQLINKPQNHQMQRLTWSAKLEANALRFAPEITMMGKFTDMVGPVYPSKENNDEAM